MSKATGDRTGPSRARRAALVGLVSAALAVTAAACSSGPTVSTGGQPATTTTVAADRLTVMTRNLYLGADLAPLLDATASNLGTTADAAYRQMQATDAPGRMASVAREIAAARPDLVALQEAVVWKDQPAGQQPTVIADFTALLLGDVAGDGVEYRVASTSDGFGGALPVPGVGLVSVQDHDVILARVDDPALVLSNPGSGKYRAHATFHVAGIAIPFERGWTSIDGRLGGRPFRLVGTHLEAYDNPSRDAQEAELLAAVAASPVPVIVAGDLNSPSTGPDSGAYQVALRHGLRDAWVSVHPNQPGFTYGYNADLTAGSMYQRIDYILLRGPFRVTAATVVGTDPSERTPSGRWPSDHAGLITAMVVPAG